MKAIIADDEPTLRRHLRERLQALWPELEICAEAANGEEALAHIRAHHPDVVFLDIRMPGTDGMEVARQAGACRVVFVTAYDQYAVEAFERHAVDYLLKPVSDQRLRETIHRLRDGQRSLEHTALQQALAGIADAMASQPQRSQWIRALQGESIALVHVDDVAYFQSGDKYTTVRTAEREYLIRTPLKDLDAVLDPERFWRIHRSVIVNVAFIAGARRTLDGRYDLTLKSVSERLTTSRAYAHRFKQM